MGNPASDDLVSLSGGVVPDAPGVAAETHAVSVPIPAFSVDQELEDVREFHRKFKILDGMYVVGHLSNRLLADRIAYMREELEEFVAASGVQATNWPQGSPPQDIDKIADSLIDLVYFAKGTAVMLGLPWAALWNEVHRANMEKTPIDTPRKAAKPEGWQPPRIREVLEKVGLYDKTKWYSEDGVLIQGKLRTDGEGK